MIGSKIPILAYPTSQLIELRGTDNTWLFCFPFREVTTFPLSVATMWVAVGISSLIIKPFICKSKPVKL